MADNDELDLAEIEAKDEAPPAPMAETQPPAPEKAVQAQPENGDKEGVHTAADLEAVFDVPVQVSAVLGRASMPISQLLKLGRGAVVELDRKVGEAIEIYVNNKLVARGEVVVVEDRLGVTMTEIIKSDH